MRTDTGMDRKRGFTLVELLVVVGIIGLLIGILMPALMKGRRAAEDAAGTANLRSLSQVMGMYTGSNGDGFLNPFGGGQAFSFAHSVAGDSAEWDFTVPLAPQMTTEAFSYYWYSYLSDLDQLPRYREEQFAPADAWMKVLTKKMKKKVEGRSRFALWPSSFLYSPTFYSSTSRYPGGDRLAATQGNIGTQFLQGVTYPSSKVMLFERADFGQTSRPTTDGQTSVPSGRPPAFNNIRAKTAVSTVDGGVREIDMSEVYAGNGGGAAGMIAAPDKPGLMIAEGHDELGHGAEPGSDALLPAFFWATQYGIEGRDLKN